MKKFMMLFIGADYNELGLSPDQIQERMGKWFAWNQKLHEQGIVESGEALTPQITHIAGPEKSAKHSPKSISKSCPKSTKHCPKDFR